MTEPIATPFKHSLRTAVILLAFTLLGTAVLAAVFNATRGIIERNQQEAKRALISEVLSKSYYDNDLISDSFELPAHALLGNNGATTAYRATRHGSFSALVIEATAPDGYSGKIGLLVAILENGEIAGVRVISHNETPGLGDYIERKKSAWIDIFRAASLQRDQESEWRVKKDGGRFDYVTGATITPRAIVKAVHKALQYFALNKSYLADSKTPS